MRHPKTLDITKTALVVIDLQEAFRSAIPEFPQVASRASMFFTPRQLGCGMKTINSVDERFAAGVR